MAVRNSSSEGVEEVIFASISPFLTVSGIRITLGRDGKLYLEWTGKGKELKDLRDPRIYIDKPDILTQEIEISRAGDLLIDKGIGRRR